MGALCDLWGAQPAFTRKATARRGGQHTSPLAPDAPHIDHSVLLTRL